MSDILTPIVFQLGIGVVGGFILGFALKKIAKIFLLLAVIVVVALLFLGVSNVLNINFGSLWDSVSGWLGSAGQAASWVVGLIAIIPFIGSFLVGFVIGFLLG